MTEVLDGLRTYVNLHQDYAFLYTTSTDTYRVADNLSTLLDVPVHRVPRTRPIVHMRVIYPTASKFPGIHIVTSTLGLKHYYLVDNLLTPLPDTPLRELIKKKDIALLKTYENRYRLPPKGEHLRKQFYDKRQVTNLYPYYLGVLLALSRM